MPVLLPSATMTVSNSTRCRSLMGLALLFVDETTPCSVISVVMSATPAIPRLPGGPLVLPARQRSAVKRSAIIAAATAEFAQRGFDAATMDGIAAAAGVSKRTVYDHFGDKERMFAAVVTSVIDRASAITATIEARFAAIQDPAHELEDLAVDYATAVTRPQVVQLRRLVIREAERFPDLAAQYYEHAPAAALSALAAGFAQLRARGLLRTEDVSEASVAFAYLVLGLSIDQALFALTGATEDTRVAAHARDGARVFVRAYC